MDSKKFKQTPLYDIHQCLGAKLVPFAGYSMPVQYPAGIIKEHLHTRKAASLFDVSHMGQIKLHGKGAAKALETLVPIDVIDLGVFQQRYAFFTNPQGGILDDLIVTNAGTHFFIVVNGACKERDIAYLQKNLGDQCEIEVLNDRALIALQGPTSSEVMQNLCPDADKLTFMTATLSNIDGIECFISRSGYTGEDGFEISVPASKAPKITKLLLNQSGVKPAGLGARDTLRLEAGLCLYGHDLNERTTPVEASLKWALSKVRRPGGTRSGGYPGANIVFEQLINSPPLTRVGLVPLGAAPVRQGAEIVDIDDTIIGHVTSGGYGATIGGPVAMGYIKKEFSQPDTQVNAIVRGKHLPLNLSKMPFIQHRYYRGE